MLLLAREGFPAAARVREAAVQVGAGEAVDALFASRCEEVREVDRRPDGVLREDLVKEKT